MIVKMKNDLLEKERMPLAIMSKFSKMQQNDEHEFGTYTYRENYTQTINE